VVGSSLSKSSGINKVLLKELPLERVNLTIRQSLAPLARKTLGFSKEKDNLHPIIKVLAEEHPFLHIGIKN